MTKKLSKKFYCSLVFKTVKEKKIKNQKILAMVRSTFWLNNPQKYGSPKTALPPKQNF